MGDTTPAVDLGAYVARIGYDGPAPTDLASLAELHRAHLLAIPFENLDIQLGRPIRLDVPAIERKLVHDRRGGYCFEQNTLFEAVLRQLGWTVSSLGARVADGTGALPPRTHKLLRLETPDGPYLCDVGFGGRGFWLPLPLQDGATGHWGQDAVRLLHRDGLWAQQLSRNGEWQTLYTFSDDPFHEIDMVVANHYTATHPASRFVQNLTAIRRRETGRLIVHNRELRLETATGTTVQPLDTPDALCDALRDHIGLPIPTGTRFRQPAF